ncbi:nuclear transport factor 2 family protein [Ruegeria marina]|uniref:Adenylate cyclase, class 3 n=1 Tax=Ruegeria marina TaxID=639004 RepID=A0A1G7FDU6_9RHOB|nr:nuclear transport factor 2 family protein [Ruegeria marina]SDE74007.1 Adenylate cyclase, class 3 [Ruegeria marina]
MELYALGHEALIVAHMTDTIRPSPELAAIVERWIKSYGRGDGETVVHLFSDDAALSYFGSAQGESWRGDALRRGMEQYIGEVPRFHWDPQEIRGFECGSLGWVEWEATIDGIETGQSARLRSTVILKLDKGSWKIVHVHNSIPVNNVEGFGYEARGFEELLDAALSTPYELGQSGIATIMFTDIADSTTIAQAIGDSLWADAVGRHLRLVETQIVESGGRLVKSLGDGVMSSFASARAALLAAQNIQQKNSAEPKEPKLQIRIGLHTGEVITSDADHFGTVVNKAARIAALAAPSDILVSDATRIMVGGSPEFQFAEQITVPLKGLDGEHTIFKLNWR